MTRVNLKNICTWNIEKVMSLLSPHFIILQSSSTCDFINNAIMFHKEMLLLSSARFVELIRWTFLVEYLNDCTIINL